EDIPLTALADEAGPSFVYSAQAVRAAYDRIAEAMSFTPHLIAYAVKANGNLALLRQLADAGCGADIVSAGELARCLRAGIPPEKIVYSGVGKTRAELRAAIEAEIRAIHIESVAELELLETLVPEGRRFPVALRINPNVDAETHPYIATGLHETKFGLDVESARALIPRLLASRRLRLEGVACHIGSQLSTTAPLEQAVGLLGAFARECLEAGATLRSVDVGGGWPMPYGDEARPFPSEQALGEAIQRGLRAADLDEFGLEVITEPGRALVGDAGLLLTRVIFVKEQGGKRFLIVDAAMTELIRPSLYGAYHAIVPVLEPAPDSRWEPADVVGPVCESGDFLARGQLLPPLEAGDLIAIRGAGAYGREMASTYNGRPLAAEILVDGDRHRIVRTRAAVESLWANERL
ncbi:MAG: diaminopimelate decarboxylase, partial [Myxococcales bacterium]|nr:diaminopimelate decarboxylase [Myxococcales bacterium]